MLRPWLGNAARDALGKRCAFHSGRGLKYAEKTSDVPNPIAEAKSQQGGPQPPKAPAGPASSTSALDYKLTHKRARPPPLPSIDPPRWSTEEAVNNILYNTPPPSTQPFVRHILNCLVQNEPGVLSRVSGILAARGFNIDSLVVCATEVKDLSRMCIVLRGQDGVIEQARRQLEDLVPVWAVLDYTRTKVIERELLLVKLSILGPEYFADQMHAKEEEQSAQYVQEDDEAYKAQSPVEPAAGSAADAGSTESQTDTQPPDPSSYPAAMGSAQPEHQHAQHQHYLPLTPSQALRQKHDNLQAISNMTKSFGGKVVDISNESVTVEISGKTSRVDAFMKLVRPFGILESARSGMMVLPRTPITSAWSGIDDDPSTLVDEMIDASALPPG